jgi:hypothetical protein
MKQEISKIPGAQNRKHEHLGADAELDRGMLR